MDGFEALTEAMNRVLHRLNSLQMLLGSPKRSAVTSSRSTIDLYTVKAQSYMKVANEL